MYRVISILPKTSEVPLTIQVPENLGLTQNPKELVPFVLGTRQNTFRVCTRYTQVSGKLGGPWHPSLRFRF